MIFRIASLALLFATTALAGCTSESSSLSSAEVIDANAPGAPVLLTYAKYDAETHELDFRYATGGGCATHMSKSSMTLEPRSAHEFDAKVIIADVSAPDPCEAMLLVESATNLGALVEAEAARIQQAVSGRIVNLLLPKFTMVVGSPSGPAPAAAGGFESSVSISALTFDATTGQLDYSYTRAGGCATHEARTRVEVTKPPQGFAHAKISIIDVASGPDSCEALIHRSGSENLQTLVANAASAQGIDLGGMTIDVELPAITSFWRSERTR